MPQYDDNMRGVLFRNQEKKTDKHPDYKGNGEIDGVEMWISAWLKESKKGVKYMSLSFEPKEGQVLQSERAGGTADVPIDTADFEPAAAATLDEDIPF